MTNHQRLDAVSNAHVGNEFEIAVQGYLSKMGIPLKRKFTLQVSINSIEKSHNFDLGSSELMTLVECKSHRWTSGNNVPSAKMTVWNEAMLYFLASPEEFRKILFVLRDISTKRNETLADYYIRTRGHLVPRGVEIWEFDEKTMTGKKVHVGK